MTVAVLAAAYTKKPSWVLTGPQSLGRSLLLPGILNAAVLGRTLMHPMACKFPPVSLLPSPLHTAEARRLSRPEDIHMRSLLTGCRAGLLILPAAQLLPSCPDPLCRVAAWLKIKGSALLLRWFKVMSACRWHFATLQRPILFVNIIKSLICLLDLAGWAR